MTYDPKAPPINQSGFSAGKTAGDRTKVQPPITEVQKNGGVPKTGKPPVAP